MLRAVSDFTAKASFDPLDHGWRSLAQETHSLRGLLTIVLRQRARHTLWQGSMLAGDSPPQRFQRRWGSSLIWAR